MADRESAATVSRRTWLDVWCWQLVTLAFLVFTASIFGFALDVGVSRVHFPVALAVVVLAGLWLARLDQAGRASIGPAVVSQLVLLALVGLSIALADAFLDVTSDGQGYHQNAVLRFANGWQGRESEGNLGVDHYPHAGELPAAALVAATNRPDIGKAWNVLLALAAYFCLLSFAIRGTKERRVPLLVSFLALMNPVVVCQLFSHYVDGQLYCWLVILPVALLRADEELSLFWGSVALFSLVCLINTKFTGLLYAIIVSGAVLAWIRLRNGQPVRRLAILCTMGILLATVCVGYRPYVTNFLQQGSPFYPALRSDGTNAVSHQMPAEFIRHNRVYKTVISLLAPSSNPIRGAGGHSGGHELPEVKMPFHCSAGEFTAFAAPDVRIGGFGPLFSGALLLAALGIAAAGREKTAFFWSCSAVIALTVLMLPDGGWWARLVPQIWLVPILALAACIRVRRRTSRWVSLLLACTLLANALSVAVVHTGAQGLFSVALREQLGRLRDAATTGRVYVRFQSFPSNAHRLARAGIRFEETDELPCDSPVPLVSQGPPRSKTLVCVEPQDVDISDTPGQNLLRMLR